MQPSYSGSAHFSGPTTSKYQDYEEPLFPQEQPQQRHDYHVNNLYYSHNAAQQYTHYDQPPHTSSSSSSDEYFSYSSEASINAGPSSSNYRDSLSQPFEQTQAPSSATSIPFQPTSAAPLTVHEQLFGYADASEQMRDEHPASTGVATGSAKQGALDDCSTSMPAAAAGNGNASDSSLSSQVSSNPLLRQDLHKNGTPKRPLNSFMIFSRWRRPQLQKEKPDIKASDLSKVLAVEWTNLPSSEKKRFLDSAKVVKANFHEMHPDYVYSRRPNGAKRSKAKRANTPSSAGSSGERGASSKPIRSARRAGSKAPLNTSTSSKPDSDSAYSQAGGGYSSSASSTCSTFFPVTPSVFGTPSRVQTPAFPPPSTAVSTSSSAFGFTQSSQPITSTSHDDPLTNYPAQSTSGEAVHAAHMLANMDLQKSVPSKSSLALLPPVRIANTRPSPQLAAPKPIQPVHAPLSVHLDAQLSTVDGYSYIESPADYETEYRAPQHTLYSSSGSSSLSSSTGSSAYSTYAQPIPAHRLPVQQIFESHSSQSRYRATSPPPAPLPSTTYTGPFTSLKTQQRLADHREGRQPALSISTTLASSTSSNVSSADMASSQLVKLPWSSLAASQSISSPSMLALSSSKPKRKPPAAGNTLISRQRNASNGSSISSSDDSNASSAFFTSASHRPMQRRMTTGDDFLLPKISKPLPQPISMYSPPLPRTETPGQMVIDATHPTLPSLSSMGLPGLRGHSIQQQQVSNHYDAAPQQASSGSQSLPTSSMAPSHRQYSASVQHSRPVYPDNVHDASSTQIQQYPEVQPRHGFTLYQPVTAVAHQPSPAPSSYDQHEGSYYDTGYQATGSDQPMY